MQYLQTVIFDSCHSGSGTRADEDKDEIIFRGTEIQVPISLDPSNDIPAPRLQVNDESENRMGFAADGFASCSEGSHVLLAACGPQELAREKDGRGVFTKALLDALCEHEDIGNLTYEDLLTKIRPLKK
jgi:hypothetical protein